MIYRLTPILKRQVTAVVDPLGRLTQFEWCTCGALEKLIDPMNKVTQWDYDLQGRVIAKKYPDGRMSSFSYDPASGKLVSATDAMGQITHWSYNVDGTLARVDYGNTHVVTPSVSYGYDAFYRRLASMTDGIGNTFYGYNPMNASIGSGKLAWIDGPWDHDTIAFGYDELGRAINVAIDGVAQTMAYDTLGRVSTLSNALGTFTPTYVGVTGRIQSVSAPWGQASYDYFTNTKDKRLKQIKYASVAGGALLAQHDYTYDVVGNIAGWKMTRPGVGNPVQLIAEYDQADQLIAATLSDAASGNTVKQWVYRYDPSANRTSEQIDLGVVSASHNELNQFMSTSGGGLIRFAGSVSEPWSAVSVLGQSAQVDRASGRFLMDIALPAGNSTVAVTATDPSGNSRTQNYQVSVPQPSVGQTFVYDLEGQMVSDGSRTFEWNGAHRLTAINAGAHRSEFGYDSHGRRVLITEKDNGTVTSDKRFVFLTSVAPAEERDGSGGVVTKRFFDQGMQVQSGTSTANFYYLRDHLGTVRELVDASGALATRYEYDAWGRQTLLSGTTASDFGFTGHYRHGPSGLNFTLYREYDPASARWLTRDPINEKDGVNLYAYAANNPLNAVDPLGLAGDEWDENIGTLGTANGRDIAGRAQEAVKSGAEKSEGYWAAILAIFTRTSRTKPVNLPAESTMQIDLGHILEGHTAGGMRVSSLKDLFPSGMNGEQIEKAIRQAYRVCKKIKTQGDRVQVRGVSADGLNIEMWINTATKTIETAYPYVP